MQKEKCRVNIWHSLWQSPRISGPGPGSCLKPNDLCVKSKARSAGGSSSFLCLLHLSSTFLILQDSAVSPRLHTSSWAYVLCASPFSKKVPQVSKWHIYVYPDPILTGRTSRKHQKGKVLQKDEKVSSSLKIKIREVTLVDRPGLWRNYENDNKTTGKQGKVARTLRVCYMVNHPNSPAHSRPPSSACHHPTAM